MLSPRKIISISAAQECKNIFRAAYKLQNRFRAAKQNRKDKKLDILTAFSNAAVQGQQVSKKSVKQIFNRWKNYPSNIHFQKPLSGDSGIRT